MWPTSTQYDLILLSVMTYFYSVEPMFTPYDDLLLPGVTHLYSVSSMVKGTDEIHGIIMYMDAIL